MVSAKRASIPLAIAGLPNSAEIVSGAVIALAGETAFPEAAIGAASAARAVRVVLAAAAEVAAACRPRSSVPAREK